MKKFLKFLLVVIILVALAAVVILGFLGRIPVLSDVLGVTKPRDLGVTYTAQDLASARAKSQLAYEALPAGTPAERSIQWSGSRPITTTWNSAELTALLNNRPWRYWPVKDVQFRINSDGTTELSGVLIHDRLSGYGAATGIPAAVTDALIKLLPTDSALYIKAKTSLTDNKVDEFDIQAVSIGKIPIPVSVLLSADPGDFATHALAQDVSGELSKFSGKKAALVEFINAVISRITGFHAKKAYFKDGQLYFDGTLSETESTLR